MSGLTNPTTLVPAGSSHPGAPKVSGQARECHRNWVDTGSASPSAVTTAMSKSPVARAVLAGFSDQLGVDTLLMGWGQDDDNTHSPNEKFCLADFHRGIKASAHLWEAISQIETTS